MGFKAWWADFRTNKWKAWYAHAMVYIVIVVVATNSVLYSNFQARKTARHFCSLVTTLDGAYLANPPTSAVGRQIAAEMHKLVRDLGCAN